MKMEGSAAFGPGMPLAKANGVGREFFDFLLTRATVNGPLEIDNGQPCPS